jgi:hypothetical protein
MQARKTFIVLTAIEKLVERKLVKQQANFIAVWSSLVLREARTIFHYNFKVGLRVHLLGYWGVNLGEITCV